MTVRFGKLNLQDINLQGIHDDLSTNSSGEETSTLEKKCAEEKFPCPILVFRMVNLQHSMHNGEIGETNTATNVDTATNTNTATEDSSSS